MTNTLDDTALVARARADDAGALDELIRRHQGTVFRVALSIVRDEEQAADVAQEALVKAIRALPKFRGEASFRTWLLTITANEARGALRKRGRRKESALEVTDRIPSRQADQSETLVAREDARRLRTCLDTLPHKQRLAVSLRVYDGLSFREVGQVIGSTEGAARVNYHHGIRKLRELMNE